MTTIKRLFFLFVIALSIVGIVACSGLGATKEDAGLDDLRENLGEKSEDVFENLGLKEGKHVEKEQDRNGHSMYVYNNETKTFHGDTFHKMFVVDHPSDRMIVFGYLKNYDNQKDGHDMMRNINEDFENDAELSRYDIQSMKISDWGDEPFNEESFPPGTSYFDQWAVDDELDVMLFFTNKGNSEFQVSIKYLYNKDAVPDDLYVPE